MNRKSIFVTGIVALLLFGASIAISHKMIGNQPAPKEIVTVDIQKLVRIKSESLSKIESGEEPTQAAQMALAKYTEQLHERLEHIASSANVTIFIKQAVLAGEYRDITDLVAGDSNNVTN